MNIARRKPLTARVGIFGVGLDTYWEQFPGLLDDLLAKKEILKRKLSAHSVELFDFGMVDNAERAAAALPQIKAADLDLLFVDLGLLEVDLLLQVGDLVTEQRDLA